MEVMNIPNLLHELYLPHLLIYTIVYHLLQQLDPLAKPPAFYMPCPAATMPTTRAAI
jgi:hypothetical protein